MCIYCTTCSVVFLILNIINYSSTKIRYTCVLTYLFGTCISWSYVCFCLLSFSRSCRCPIITYHRYFDHPSLAPVQLRVWTKPAINVVRLLWHASLTEHSWHLPTNRSSAVEHAAANVEHTEIPQAIQARRDGATQLVPIQPQHLEMGHVACRRQHLRHVHRRCCRGNVQHFQVWKLRQSFGRQNAVPVCKTKRDENTPGGKKKKMAMKKWERCACACVCERERDRETKEAREPRDG